MLTFLEARATVLREVQAQSAVEFYPLDECHGSVLAQDAVADRNYPPFDRATRDGFGVRGSDIPGRLRVIGESRAGHPFGGVVSSGEAVEIMTGAPTPQGVDAVVMVEFCTRSNDGTVFTDRTAIPGCNVALAGCDVATGGVVLKRGKRIDHTAVAWLATIGMTEVPVFARPRVAILATGDEIVEVGAMPSASQIRNSNAHALAAQVRRAGGEPVILPVAPDDQAATARLIAKGLEYDLLLLSGGVSAGKYDFVEPALTDCEATFFFDRVAIQPGQPLVFGKARGKFFFGLPGNPASTMVTFELFARAAIDLLSGATEAPLPVTMARLTRAFSHKAGLTRFLPATLTTTGVSCTEVTPVDWQGSGDVPSLCRANAFLVADANQPEYAEGDMIPVLAK
ncbi:MAG TPA: gephyrin-like molybdotransferase Glp [Bryobacteraceae bacterium]|nr:gephyrin-like molybdotransferase Glp [Bryobacteraceae bacterium]